MDTIDLLWRNDGAPAPRRGRPPKLSTDRVVAAAIATADRSGTSFTLREVAEELGTAVMSLYSYVGSRDQLMELMVDQCHAEMASTAPTGDWHTRLTTVAADNLELFMRHPWLAELESERAVLGPGTLGKYERELTALEPLPLSDVDKDAALTLVVDYVRSSARALSSARRQRALETPAQWWDREGVKMAKFDVAQRFPLASRIGAAAGQARGAARDAEAAHQFGLTIILRGIGAAAEID